MQQAGRQAGLRQAVGQERCRAAEPGDAAAHEGEPHPERSRSLAGMSVPLSVFEAAGYADADAKKTKRKFDEQEVSLQHLANGDITQVLAVRRCTITLRSCADRRRPHLTPRCRRPCCCKRTPHADCSFAAQDMLRDEFGIGQLGKRLKLLEAAKAASAKAPKTKRRAAPADPEPEKSKDVVVRQRKGKQPAQPRPATALAEPRKPQPPDRRSMKQKIMDPKTVAEINELRNLPVQMSDWCSRTLGGARDVVAVGAIVLSLAYWGATAMNVLPPGMNLLP